MLRLDLISIHEYHNTAAIIAQQVKRNVSSIAAGGIMDNDWKWRNKR